MLRQIGKDLGRGGVATGNADRQRSNTLTADLIDARRQQRNINGKLTRKAGHDRVAGVAANKHADDSLPTRDLLFLWGARDRDRERIVKDICKDGQRDRMVCSGEDVGYISSFYIVAAVRDDSRLKCWKIVPMDRCANRSSRPDSAEISRPSTSTRPVVGFSRPLMSRTRLDLPAPERPMTPVIEPRGIAKSIFCSARTLGCRDRPDRSSPLPGIAPSRLLWQQRCRAVKTTPAAARPSTIDA